MELFDIAPAVFQGGSTLNIQQLDSVDPDPQIQEMVMRGGGSVDPLMYATAMTDPRVKLASRDVQTILATVSVLNGFYANNGAKIQYKAQASGSDYASGNAHVTITSPLAFLYVEDYGAKQGDKEGSDINLTYCPLFDGTTAPLNVNVNQALSSSVALNALHHLGPIKVEGNWLNGVQSVRVKPAVEIQTKSGDGVMWPQLANIKTRAPSIEIEAHNLSIMAVFGMNGTYPISNGVVSYLLRVLSGAGRYAPNTNNHIATSATSGVYKVTGITGSKNESAMGKITVLPTTLSVATATSVA